MIFSVTWMDLEIAILSEVSQSSIIVFIKLIPELVLKKLHVEDIFESFAVLYLAFPNVFDIEYTVCMEYYERPTKYYCPYRTHIEKCCFKEQWS